MPKWPPQRRPLPSVAMAMSVRCVVIRHTFPLVATRVTRLGFQMIATMARRSKDAKQMTHPAGEQRALGADGASARHPTTQNPVKPEKMRLSVRLKWRFDFVCVQRLSNERASSRARAGAKTCLAPTNADFGPAARPFIHDQTTFAHPKLDHTLQCAGLNIQPAAERAQSHRA